MKLFNLKVVLSDGKYYIDKTIKANDEHDALRVGSNQFEYFLSQDIKKCIPESVIYFIREGKVQVTEI